MANALKKHFPMIKDREEVLEEIHNKADLKRIFYGWTDSQRAEFLDVCTGVKGVKLLYDHFFKAVINPDTTPERLEELLSLILDTKVRILKVLPNDSTRIAAVNKKPTLVSKWNFCRNMYLLRLTFCVTN